MVLGIVLLNVALNVRSVVRHWAKLTLLHHLLGITIWLVLPLTGVLLLYQGKAIGRWILVGLLGMRAVIGLLWFGIIVTPLGFHHPERLVTSLYRDVIIEILVYSLATLWLVFSPGIRQICSKANAN